MLKILSIVPYNIFPVKSGGQKAIALFNEYLAKRADITCVTVKSNEPRFSKTYTLLNVLSNHFFRYLNFFYFSKIKKLIAKYAITHVLIEHPYFGWLGILLKTFTRTKLIVRSHNIESLRWKGLGKWWWQLLWWYERTTHRQADYNLFIQDDDRKYAIEKFGLDPKKCLTILYGIEWKAIQPKEQVAIARQQIRKHYQIADDERILLFNGAFNYSPNSEALKKIIGIINPLLKQKINFNYKIIICGRDIPDTISHSNQPDIIFAGFVDDISMYYKAADVFINPVTEGGGIKTKLVEALGYNLNAVSTLSGATGIDPAWCNGKLIISENSNWEQFAELIITASTYQADLPQVYFQNFYWDYSIQKAVAFLQHA